MIRLSAMFAAIFSEMRKPYSIKFKKSINAETKKE